MIYCSATDLMSPKEFGFFSPGEIMPLTIAGMQHFESVNHFV